MAIERSALSGRVPPQSLEGEQAVLGSMLIEEAAIDRVVPIVCAEDFYRDAHRVIFEAIISLHERGRRIDLLTVREHLQIQDVLENIGGPTYLIHLTNAVPSAANAEHYARIVEERSTLRRMIDASNQIFALAHTEYDELDDLLVRASRAIETAVHRPGSRCAADELPLAAGEFLKTIGEPPPMIVEQIFPDNSFVLWVGKPKAGKSLYVLDLCQAVSEGRPVYGQFAVNKPGPVLYVDMENPAHEIANRLLKRGIRPGEVSSLYIKRANFRLDAAGMARLSRWVAALKPTFVVIDSAREALGIKEWYGDPAEIVDKVRPVREFAQAVCPVLMVAHSRKAEAADAGDEISANNAFAGAVDGWISARKVDFNTDKSLVHHYQVRGRGMLGDFVAMMDPENLSIRVLADQELREQQHASEYREIGELMSKAKEPLTEREIKESLDVSQPKTNRLIKEMIRSNRLKECEPRENPKGRPSKTYQLISFNPDPRDMNRLEMSDSFDEEDAFA